MYRRIKLRASSCDTSVRYMEDIFVTKLYSSGVLRYAETNSDIDMGNFWKFTAKGPMMNWVYPFNCGKLLIA